MKKALVSVAILLTVLCGLSAANKYLDTLVKGIQVYGYIDQYCIIYTTPIDVNTNDAEGMPFSIEDSTVRFNSNDQEHITGRKIATWSFATNLPAVKLTFNADALTHEMETSYSLNYYMVFRYQYSGDDGSGNTTTNTGYITVHSGEEKVVTLDNYAGANDLPIISMANDVRIQLDQTYDVTNYPTGFYYSNVIISLEGL